MADQLTICKYCNQGLPDDRYLKCDGNNGCKSFVHWRCSLKTAIDIAEFVYTKSHYKCKDCSIKHICEIKKFTESQCEEKTKEILQYLGVGMRPAHTPNTTSPRTNDEPLNTTVYKSCSEDSSDDLDDLDDSLLTEGVQDLSEVRRNEETSSTIATPNTPTGSVENASPSLETIVTAGNGTPPPSISEVGRPERTEDNHRRPERRPERTEDNQRRIESQEQSTNDEERRERIEEEELRRSQDEEQRIREEEEEWRKAEENWNLYLIRCSKIDCKPHLAGGCKYPYKKSLRL